MYILFLNLGQCIKMSIFSSDGHFVQRSITGKAILVRGPMRKSGTKQEI